MRTHHWLAQAAATAVSGLAIAAALPVQAQAVFDPAAGLPSAQGWQTFVTPGAVGATESLGAGVYTFDSTGAGVVAAGHLRLSPVALDPVAGWRADVSLRIVDENHAHANRAGFSMIFIGSLPSQSLELAFWEDRVFAYEYVSGAFVQGAGAQVDTQSAMHTYTLAAANGLYTVSRDGSLLFGGSLQNYTPQGLPYVVPGALFFGDDTSSASARVEIGSSLLLSPIPEPASAVLLLAGLAGLAGMARRRA